ncbi:MAG: pirin family protein, partial [Gammaproteobacteria bacterium]|nr:pirin family protein [Gammaproteobacteria bacterium]
PQQTEGRMRGFQLWINLPAREKMKPPAYRGIPRSRIPTVALSAGGEARVIAGTLRQGDAEVTGPIDGLSTEPMYFDVRLPPGVSATIPTPVTHNVFLYVYEGDAVVGENGKALPYRAAGLLTPGDELTIRAGERGVQALLLAGRPIGEPVVQYGPFVMNTPLEIQQAIVDYQRGTLAPPV